MHLPSLIEFVMILSLTQKQPFGIMLFCIKNLSKILAKVHEKKNLMEELYF